MKNIILYYITIPILFLVLLSLTSCYTNYYGKYRLGKFSTTYKLKPASEEDYKKLYEVVKKVALDYGFTQRKGGIFDKPEYVGFIKSVDTKGIHEELEGSDGPISIILFLEPYPSISIKDSRRIHESEFMKFFKIELERSLSEVVDMDGVVFERQLEVLN
jgi:hypothetical protein